MMPYQVYQLYQAERPKSPADIRRIDEQLGRAAQSRSRLWRRAAKPIGILPAPYREQLPARLPPRPLPTHGRARAIGDQIAVACPDQR
jgi:hypothetical protein